MDIIALVCTFFLKLTENAGPLLPCLVGSFVKYDAILILLPLYSILSFCLEVLKSFLFL